MAVYAADLTEHRGPGNDEDAPQLRAPTGTGAQPRATGRQGAAKSGPRPTEGQMMDGKNEMLKTMVLVSPEGNVLSTKGDDAEEFANLAAYSTQLAKLIGDGLGLDGLQGLDCEFKRGRCLIYFDHSGNIVGVRPRPEIPMSKIREMLGFS